MSLVERAREIHQRLRNPPNAVPDHGIDLRRHRQQCVTVEIKPERFDTFTQAQAEPATPYGVGSAVPRYGLTYDFSGTFTYFTFIRNIQKAVCNAKGIRLDALLSKRRAAPIVRARMIAVYLARKLTEKSFPELGRRFGGRDHTTILHSVRKIAAERLVDPKLDRELTELELLLKRPHNQAEDAPCNSPQTRAI